MNDGERAGFALDNAIRRAVETGMVREDVIEQVREFFDDYEGGVELSEHRCWGCGTDQESMPGYGDTPDTSRPIDCGELCIDCSYEEHLAAMAHTGEYDEPRDGTPACCLATRALAAAFDETQEGPDA